MQVNLCRAAGKLPYWAFRLLRSQVLFPLATLVRKSLSLPNTSKSICLLRPSLRSGRWESNPVYILPKDAYDRYTTARFA